MKVTVLKNRKNGKRRGSTLIEFALVAPVLLFLTFGLIQFGIYMNAAVSLTNLSREGARYAATQPNSDTGIRDRMEDVCPPSIKWADIRNNITISTIDNQPRVRPYLIQVQITYNMRNKLFMPTAIGGWRIVSPTYTARGIMMME